MFCLKTDFSKENTGDSGKNAFGRTSVLNISASAKEGKPYLKELGFTAPFKVMTPFEQENGGMKIMMLMASAGIMRAMYRKFPSVQKGEPVWNVRHSHSKRSTKWEMDMQSGISA